MDDVSTLKLPALSTHRSGSLLQERDAPVASSLPLDRTPTTPLEDDDLTITIKRPRVEKLGDVQVRGKTVYSISNTSFSRVEKLGDVQVRVVPANDYADLPTILTPSIPGGIQRRQSLFVFRNVLLLLLIIIATSTLLYSGFVFSRKPHPLHVFSKPGVKKTVAINGASRWQGDTEATEPTFNFSAATTQTLGVSPLFEHYYNSHNGALSLGNPVTVAFPTEQGWIQFFGSGALLLPTDVQKHPREAENALVGLVNSGVRDPDTGIIRLPLLQALLTVGSKLPIGGDGSHLTYVDLRQATNPNRMLQAPKGGRTSSFLYVGSRGVFIKGGIRGGKDVGHLIPLPLWNYINRSDVSPDGWETDFGAPLTEALAFTVMKNGSVHHMLVQAFWRDGLILDQSTLDASGRPQIQRLDTGVAYLRTVGPPTVATGVQQTVWVPGDTALLRVPGTSQALAHVGQHFPLTLLTDTAWSAGMLWYHVQWRTPKHTSMGWVAASAITFASPGTVPSWASLDVLSPELATYLANIGDNAGAVVYDVTRQRYYTYNANAQFTTASSMKVAIMLTFLDTTESQGREPNDDEMNLLTTMIENSDNDSASTLYYNDIGGATGVANYLQKIGISDLTPNSTSWGYSQISPLSMVNLLTLLHEGKILTDQDRKLALSLMESIESDQQVGAGDTAPSGATVAMKDGWAVGPDGLWVMNSSGIVTSGSETYIISVYSQSQSTLDDGQAIIRHVCGTVASLLI